MPFYDVKSPDIVTWYWCITVAVTCLMLGKGETLDDWSQARGQTLQMRVVNIGPTCRCPSSH